MANENPEKTTFSWLIALLAFIVISPILLYGPSVVSFKGTTRPGPPDWLIELRPWLESAFFLSNILLLLVAAYGAQQIILLKRDIETKNLRASKEMTAQYCGLFAQFVLMRRRFVRECEEAGLELYSGDVGDFSLQGFDVGKWKPIVEKKMKLDTAIAALNQLEQISMVFLSRAADEGVAFKTFGRAFCATVGTHYDIFTIRGSEQYFQNVIELYKLWSSRIERNKLTKERDAIEERIRSTPNKEIPPIGL
ncbi:MAG: hypothetical protein ABR964_16245 [Tepidisphaeraceae bacterium]|jgi:hypothetical protein